MARADLVLTAGDITLSGGRREAEDFVAVVGKHNGRILAVHGNWDLAGVKDFLETHRVDLCLCGHIHEAGGIESFQGTMIANEGAFRRGGYLTVNIGENILIKEENLIL